MTVATGAYSCPSIDHPILPLPETDEHGAGKNSPVFAIPKSGHHNTCSTQSTLFSSACKNLAVHAFKTYETLASGRQIAGQQLPTTLSPRGDKSSGVLNGIRIANMAENHECEP